MAKQDGFYHRLRDAGTLTLEDVRALEAIPPGKALVAKVRVSRVTDHAHGLFKTVELEGVPTDRKIKPRLVYSNQGQSLSLRVSDPALIELLKLNAVFRLELDATDEGIGAELGEDLEPEDPPTQ